MRPINPNGIFLGVFEAVAEGLQVDSAHLRLFACLAAACLLVAITSRLVLAAFIVAALYVLCAMVLDWREKQARRSHGPKAD